MEGENLEDLSVSLRIIIKRILKNSNMGGRGVNSSISGPEQTVGFCEHGNEISSSIKSEVFFTL
jgi:hypothetical protein